MDEEWKKQNEALDAAGGSSPQASTPNGQLPGGATGVNQGLNPGQTIKPQPGTTELPSRLPDALEPSPQQPPAQPSATTPQPISDAYDQASSGSSRKKIVVTLICLVLLAIPAGIGGHALLSGKKDKTVDNQANGGSSSSQNQPQQQISGDQKSTINTQSWRTVDTKLGFSIKTPVDWAASDVTASTIGGFNISAIFLATTDDTLSRSDNSANVGVESLEGSSSQAEFESTVTSVDKTAETLKDQNIGKDQIKITSNKVNINGKEWLQVDTDLPSQSSRTLYLWNGDHEIFLTVVAASKDSLSKLISNYLQPMATSIELK